MNDCSKCGAAMMAVSPKTIRDTVFACQRCGHTETASGKAINTANKEKADIFRAASLSSQVVSSLLRGKDVNPAAQALMQAELTGLGVECWMDGYKQGILVSAIKLQKEGSDDR